MGGSGRIIKLHVGEQNRVVSKDRFILSLTIILWLIYETIMLYLFSRIDAMVPDEIWFYSIVDSMRTYTFKEIIAVPNNLGYGSIYWIILVLLRTKKRMRIFSFICISVLPLAVFLLQKKLFKRKDITILISMMILFCCPMTWFTGKIIGPGLMGNAIGIIGITIILFIVERNGDKRDILQYITYLFGFGLIGISAGIKLYNVIFAVFIGLYMMYPLMQGSGISVSRRINLILLKSLPMIGSFTIKNIYDILFLHRVEWDLVYSGGINHGIISVVALITLILASLFSKRERRLVLSLLVSILGCVVLVLSNSGEFYC